MADKRDILDAKGPGLTLGDLLKQLQRKVEMDLKVAAPATTISYNPTTQRAVVELGFLPVEAEDNGDISVQESPIRLYEVPVSFPRSSQGFVNFPLSASGGDTGMLVFSDRALANWLRVGKATDPIRARAHNLADGVFFPGITTDVAPMSSPAHIAGTASVLEGPLVHLGNAATQPVIKGTAYTNLETTFLTAMIAFLTGYQSQLATLQSAGGTPAAVTAFATAMQGLAATLQTATGVYSGGRIATLSTKVFTE